MEAIEPPHFGRVKYQGSFWNARCEKAVPTGSMVRIVERDDNDPNAFIVKEEN